MKTKITSLILAGLFGATIASQAAVITMPTGLSYGDQYRLVFVTSTTRDATSADIDIYNDFVNAAAALNTDLAWAGEWTAIASTDTVNAIDNTSTTGTGVPIYLLNDTLFAADYTTLWTTNAKPSLNITEQGVIGGTSLVWTGTKSSGFADGADELGDGTPRAGKSDVTSGQNQSWWITRINRPNNTETLSLFAISGILTVPEPSSTALLGLGGLALMLRRKRS